MSHYLLRTMEAYDMSLCSDAEKYALKHIERTCETHMLAKAGCFGPNAAIDADVRFYEDLAVVESSVPFRIPRDRNVYIIRPPATKCVRRCMIRCVRCMLRAPCAQRALHMMLRCYCRYMSR